MWLLLGEGRAVVVEEDAVAGVEVEQTQENTEAIRMKEKKVKVLVKQHSQLVDTSISCVDIGPECK